MKVRRVGVSVYPGLECSYERIKKSLQEAAELGVSRVFTSLHIPESEATQAVKDCARVCSLAKELNMDVLVDISPVTFETLGANHLNLQSFVNLGIDGIRVDYGFSSDDLLSMINNSSGLTIVLNATVLERSLLDGLASQGVNLAALEALHNFYPRPESGLSMNYYKRQSALLKEYGLQVSGFVAGQHSKRAPIYAGLPTVEIHRQLSSARAAQELFATGVTDSVYIGDPFPHEEELIPLVQVATSEVMKLRVDVHGKLSDLEREIIFGRIHTQPYPNCYEYVIRSSSTRELGKQYSILPSNTVARPRGTVTVDNASYGRYAGEVQITLKDLPADPRVNVIGTITEEDFPLLEYIGDMRVYKGFCLVES